MHIILIILFLLICAAALYHGLTVRKYTIQSDLSNTLNIAVVSDLHNTRHKKLIDKIREIRPDLIALTGDIIDNDYPMKYVNAFLDEVSKLNIPVYYVTGNHEMGALETQQFKDEIRERGITVLEDRFLNVEINGISLTIAGIDDTYKLNISKWQREVTDKFADIKNQDTYKILLAHRPDLWKIYEDFGVDLAISGHAHGGQVRIPFILNGLFSPNQGLFPKYAGGLYKHGKMNHVVSRGLSVFVKLPRVFNPPELVHIEITSNHNTSQ